jgi:hypothetical protein
MTIETLTKAAWLLLALGHLAPCAPLFAPKLLERLYAISPGGDIAVLLRHRALFFALVVTLCVWAAVQPSVRLPALAVTGASVIGFLLLYAQAGTPTGALRTVALVDAALLLPLAFLLWAHLKS